nr:MAG TPA: hypothetical protein [Caudoviricetes sp.]
MNVVPRRRCHCPSLHLSFGERWNSVLSGERVGECFDWVAA